MRAGRAVMLAIAALLVACSPLSRELYDPSSVKPAAKADVVLALGERRYVVIASGTGVPIRTRPDPAASLVETMPFASVGSSTAQVSGADGKTWRRVGQRGWASRDGLLDFPTVRQAVNLAIELRVFSPPSLRNTLLGVTPTATPLPPTSSPAGTLTPRPSPTSTRVPTRAPPTPTRPLPPTVPPAPIPEPLYGVVVRADARERDTAGGAVGARPNLEIGTVVGIVDEAVGPDGRRALRLEENTWVDADEVVVYGTLAEATNAAYRATMAALAPDVEIDQDLRPALWLLRRDIQTRYLADAIRDIPVPVRVRPLTDPDLIATYSIRERAITFSSAYIGADVRVLTAALTHEAVHAWEHKQGLVLTNEVECFEAELRAFRAQSEMWGRFYGPQGKEKPATRAENEQNEVLRMVTSDLGRLKVLLVNRYGQECGYAGPLPTVGPGPTSIVPQVGTPRPGGTPAPRATPASKPAGQPKVATP